MEELRFNAFDELGNEFVFDRNTQNGTILLTLKKETLKGCTKLYALADFTAVAVEEDGYYVIPRNIYQNSDLIIGFQKREEFEHIQERPIMALIGVKKKDACYLIRVPRHYYFDFKITLSDGKYRAMIVYDLSRDPRDPKTLLHAENIEIEIIKLSANATYNDMALTERRLRLERGEIHHLSEKCRREAVEYARKYPLIRIRQGWKPSPSYIKHQTVETEPPMHVACSFARVRDLIDELNAQGVEGAEIQLVGWNIKGHDGRFPQHFPIDEELGGEQEMKKTIDYAKANGYRISAHTNMWDAYEIADSFDWNDIAIDGKGNHARGWDTSGGYIYLICPLCQRKHIEEYLPPLAALGLNGIHFTDCYSLNESYACHSPRHPISYKKSLEVENALAHYTKELFGAFSSEGCLDHTVDLIDYGLYVTFGDGFGVKTPAITTALIPFFEIVYHGTLLYNPTSSTINYTLKTPADKLMFVMRGGRPSMYFYSKFRTGGEANWMGDNDLTCGTDKELTSSVKAIKEALDEYSLLADKQLVYWDGYDLLGEGLERARYSDGTAIIGNFSNEEKVYDGSVIPPYGYIIR